MDKSAQKTFKKDFSKLEGYLLAYLDELSIHFDLPSEDLEIILMNVYNKIQTPNSFKKMVNMLKFLRF